MIKKILITGVSSGIGYVMCQKLLTKGIKVIGVCRRANTSFSHKNYYPYNVDLSQPVEIDENFKTIIKNHSDLDSVLSNAGVAMFGNLEQHSSRQIIENININLLSHILVIKNLLPTLKQQQKITKIIVIGSYAGLQGGKQGSIYCSAKFALQGLVESLQIDCASSNIKISIIKPAMIKATNFYDKTHFEPADDVLNYVDMEDVTNSIMLCLDAKNGSVFAKINIGVLKKVIRFKK
jgi:NADP-dependent 3-hydroxy acid dehydrogenase YdfG